MQSCSEAYPTVPHIPNTDAHLAGPDHTVRSNVTMTYGNAVAVVVQLGPRVMDTRGHTWKGFG